MKCWNIDNPINQKPEIVVIIEDNEYSSTCRIGNLHIKGDRAHYAIK